MNKVGKAFEEDDYYEFVKKQTFNYCGFGGGGASNVVNLSDIIKDM